MVDLTRQWCTKNDECWQFIYMVNQRFTETELYKVCRKCIYYNGKEGELI